MADIEKVLNGLECCKSPMITGVLCNSCPYWDDNNPDEYQISCNDNLCADALELLKEQQNEIWELQELNEHLTDQQKKVRMFIDSKGEIHPLEPEPVEPKEETNSNNLHGSFWTCGKCGQAITVSKGFVRYCWNCGTPVKWD